MHRPEADLREALALLEAWLADYQDGPQPAPDDPLHAIAQLHADLMRREADRLHAQLLRKPAPEADPPASYTLGPRLRRH